MFGGVVGLFPFWLWLCQEEDIAYSPQMAMIMARLICDINSKTSRQGASFAQQFILQKGIKKFGHHGKAAARKEIDQLHRRTCFTPIDISTLTEEEKAKAMEALMFLTEKRGLGIHAWINALGTSLLITSHLSLASTIAVRKILSVKAVGLVDSSLFSHTRVGLPL